jgi:hypothetical protein
MAMYTGMALFLGGAIVSVIASAQRSQTGFELDRTWLAGVSVFGVLLAVTYGTPLSGSHPAALGVIYVTLTFLALGLAGQAQLNHPPPDVLRQGAPAEGFLLALAGFVMAAYGELLSASWLRVPPKPHEVRTAARVLCRLATESDRPLGTGTVEDRVVRLPFRLGLIEVAQEQLRLAPKGLDFLRTRQRCTDVNKTLEPFPLTGSSEPGRDAPPDVYRLYSRILR